MTIASHGHLVLGGS